MSARATSATRRPNRSCATCWAAISNCITDRRRPRATASRCCTVENFCAGNQGPLSFTVGQGEVVGLVGLRGGGPRGDRPNDLRRPSSNRRHDQARLRRSFPPGCRSASGSQRGIALLAGDRLGESALSGMSLRENLFPNTENVAGGLSRRSAGRREASEVSDVLERFDVRPRNGAALIDWLSGGNQQKVFVGRWLATGARLFIMEEPTAGVDIGAKGVIHRMLRDIAAEGAGVLVVSSDFEEVAALCDRALVIGRGMITADLAGTGADSGKSAHAIVDWRLSRPRRCISWRRTCPTPRSSAAPRRRRRRRASRAATLSNLVANYGLLFVFLLIMLVFGLLRPSSFFSATNINAILVSQSVTAILALRRDGAARNQTVRPVDRLSPWHGAGADRRAASDAGPWPGR